MNEVTFLIPRDLDFINDISGCSVITDYEANEVVVRTNKIDTHLTYFNRVADSRGVNYTISQNGNTTVVRFRG